MAREEVVFSARRTIAILLVAGAIIGIVAWQSVLYLKPKLAARYIERGITYFKVQNYDAARTEFSKAERAHAAEGSVWIERTTQAETDPLALQPYWQQWQVSAVLRKLEEAAGPFATPKEALAKGIQLYNSGESQYAQYAISSALTKDPDYPEAWHYRYLTYTELAKENAHYREQAEQARQKRDSLTSLYLNP